MSSRLATSAGVIAVLSGLEATVAQQWGVPRAAVTETNPTPGRGVIRSQGQWDAVQLAWSDQEAGTQLAASLETASPANQVSPAPWGIGGDYRKEISPPTGHVAIVGPPGPERDALAESLADAQVTCVELPALVPSDATAVIVNQPTARAVRAVAPHQWRGVTDPAPLPGHVVVVQGGQATAVRLVLAE